MYHIPFIHFFVEEHLCCFHFLTITNKAAMNIVEQVCLRYDRVSFGYVPTSGIAGSWGGSVTSIHVLFISSFSVFRSWTISFNCPPSPLGLFKGFIYFLHFFIWLFFNFLKSLCPLCFKELYHLSALLECPGLVLLSSWAPVVPHHPYCCCYTEHLVWDGYRSMCLLLGLSLLTGRFVLWLLFSFWSFGLIGQGMWW